MTREGLGAVRAELRGLRKQRDEYTARFRDARAAGDAGSDDERLQIMEEQAVLDARIASLEALVGSATIVDESTPASNGVSISSRVEVEDLDSGGRHRWRLVGDHEGVSDESVSASSPIGRALLGRAIGDEVVVELPNSRVRRLRIVGVGGDV